jgi:hypothetical protein
MFSSNNELISVLAVLLSITIIGSILYFVNKLFINETQEILVKFILLIFSALVGVYVVDKIIAFKISLLSEKEDSELFDLIKTLILMIFSYYFGTKQKKNIKKNN